jgi:hypothetical protein
MGTNSPHWLTADFVIPRARAVAARVGVTFHVGSQCLDPAAYARAIELESKVALRAGVRLDVLDVGGGFPVAYPDQVPPPVDVFGRTLGEAVARTFSPEARCNLCAAVSEGKQQQQGETALNPKFEDRSLLICEPAPQFLFEADDVAGWLDNRTRLAGISRERPPVPPPRV